MIHAYQKGKLGKATAKVKDIAAHISPTNALHFAETKHKGLREHVKKAGLIKDIIAALLFEDSPETYHKLKEVDKDKLIAKLQRSGGPTVSFDTKELRKRAFDLGFMSAATSDGVHPLRAVEMLKHAQFK